MTQFKITTRSTQRVITPIEARAHLRLFGDTSDDTEITEFVFAAQQYLDDYLGEFIGETSVQVPVDSFPRSSPIELPHRFIKNLVSVQYYDASDTLTTVNSNIYLYDDSGVNPVVRLRSGQSWPSEVSEDREYPVQINYLAGLTSDSNTQSNVDSAIRSAVLLILSELYANRESYLVGQTYVNLPITAERLLRGYRRIAV